MTARIVGQVSRETYAELGIPMTDLPIDGDDGVTPMIRQAFGIRGQLWQRVEQAGPNGDALTAEQVERISAVRNRLGTRNTRRLYVRGPRIRDLMDKPTGPVGVTYRCMPPR